MSRLYGRAFDIYETSRCINASSFPKYREDNTRITIDELIDSSATLDIYLPESAIDYIVEHPIHICKSPLIPKHYTNFPSEKDPNGTIFFKCVNHKEEQKRDLIFFLGCILSEIHPDELPKSDDLPCEYGDIFPLILEYLFLRDNGKEDRFITKHLNCLKYYAEKYQKIYEGYQRYIVNSKQNDLRFLSEGAIERINDQNTSYEKNFLKQTLTLLIPYSSLDGMLQIIDKFKTNDEYKKLIEELYLNPNNNRQEILKDHSIESFGYKRLRREIEYRRGR